MQINKGENRSLPNPQLWPYADLWSKLKCTLNDLVVDSGIFFHQEK